MKVHGILLAGLIVFLLSLIWHYLLPRGAGDDARAAELTDASESLHETMHAHGQRHDHDHFGATGVDDPPEVVAASKRYSDVQAELDAARFWSESVPRYLRWSGLAICGLGVVLYLTAKRA